ncbi:hypothetical protein [Vibrio sp. CAU 1672]|uniref:hypothetical protein n=1 Tax=Vibrio sp. CAU 1672 TaxID=3032594 RepID=UPI0023DAAF1F|nr:hypothetical protein [Vibrio sp. CAU 1672]MDF2153094.1 hypothetical protein [Vibrio sp. CAU 1672]
MKVSTFYKLSTFVLVVLIAYVSAWMRAYSLSDGYFTYAEQQYSTGNLVLALKGMNKQSLRKGDDYFGGYQQVIEAWHSSTLGPRPEAYYHSLEKPKQIIEQLSVEELLEFIDVYVQLDSRYVPVAADQVRVLAKQAGDAGLYNDMTAFLTEAFPRYKQQEI